MNEAYMKIMLADDLDILRSALRYWLEQNSSFQIVAEVGEAKALLPQVLAHQPDILLLDWELRGLQHDQQDRLLVRALHAALPHLRIIAMSAQPEAQTQALAAGADAFVSKAEPPENLMQRLRWFVRPGPDSQGACVSPLSIYDDSTFIG